MDEDLHRKLVWVRITLRATRLLPRGFNGRAGYHRASGRYRDTEKRLRRFVNILMSFIFYLLRYCLPRRDDAFFRPVPTAAGDMAKGSGRTAAKWGFWVAL